MEVAALGLKVEGVQQIDQAATSLEKLGKASESAESSAKKFNSGAKETKRDIEALGAAASKAAQEEAKLAAMAEKAGMSVNQMKAALRGVPAQFTDIAVSLQGGMSPLTVFLQQGGQLKDMFGGAGMAARALGGYIAGLVNPLSVGATAVIALSAAYYQGSKEANAFRTALASTGNSAGLTTSALISYSESISSAVGTQGKAVESLNMFITAGVRGTDTLAQFTQTAIEWEKATGEGVDEVAEKFRALQDDPLKAALKLNEGMNFLTLSVYEQIKSLEEQGRSTDAAKVAMEALDSAMADRSKSIIENLGYMEIAANGVASAFKSMWDGLKNVGRDESLETQLAGIDAEIEQLSSKNTKASNLRIAALQRERGALVDKIDAERINAAASQYSAEQVKNQVAWDKIRESNLDKQTKMERELTQVRNAAAAAGVTGAALEEQLAAVREKYAEKTKKASQSDQNAYKSILVEINKKIAAVEKEISTGEKLTEAEQLRLRLQEEIATRGRKISKQEIEQAEAKIKQLEALERYNEALKYTDKAIEDYTKAQQAALAKIDESVEKLRLEEEAHELAEEKNISHAEAVERLTIARLDEARAQIAQGAGTAEELRLIDLQIAKRKQMLALLEGKAGREASEKAFKELEKAGEKSAKFIQDTLSDYIMSGGKDAATYLERIFRNLVLQPVVNYGVQGVLGAMGIGESSGGGGVGGIASNISSLNSLGNLLNGGLASSVGGVIGSLGSAIGSSALASVATGMKGATLAAGLAGPTTAGASGLVGLGSTIGAAMPYIGGALAVASLLKGAFSGEHRTGSQYGIAYDGEVINRRRDQTYTNAGQNYRNPYGTGAALETGRAYLLEGADPSDADASVAKAIEVTAAGIDDLFALLGSEARLTGFWAGFETSGKGRGGVMSGGMLADGTIFGESGQGDNYAGTLYEKFSSTSPDFEQALKDFELDLKQVTLQALQAADDLPSSISKMLEGVETELMAEDAVDALLVKIQGIATGAAQLGSALDLMDLSRPAGNIIDFTAALSEFNGGLENSLNLLSSFYTSFYSEEERMRTAAEQMNKALAAIDISIDPMLGDEAKAQYRAAVDAALAAGDAELYAALLNMSSQFASIADYAADAAKKAADDAKKAEEDARQSLIDAAWDNFEAAVDRETELINERISSVQESITALNSMQEMLRMNARQLYGTIDAAAQMQAVQGMLYVENALDSVRGGASILGFTGLEDSITAARSGISNSNNYASAFDQQRDALILAGQLTELGDLTDVQLSVEEKQLKVLNEQLSYYESLMRKASDMMSGIDTLIDKTLTPEAAYEILMRVLHGDTTTVEQKPPVSSGGSSDGAVFGPGSGSAASSPYSRTEVRLTRALNGDASAFAEIAAIKQAMHSFDGTGDLAGLMAATIAAGGTALDVSREYGYDLKQLESVLSEAGVPAYEQGTPFVPETGLALLHQGEAVIPKAYNPFSGASSAQRGSTASDALLVQLINDNRTQAGEIIRLNGRIARLLERWDGDGLPETREVANA